MSQGLKPHPVEPLNVWAKAQTYLRSKSSSRSVKRYPLRLSAEVRLLLLTMTLQRQLNEFVDKF